MYNGQIVHSEDTGVGQETFAYSVGGDCAARTRQRLPVANPATPFMPATAPYSYTGVFTDVDAPRRRTPSRRRDPTTNPVTVIPWRATASGTRGSRRATVVDPQRTEGEPARPGRLRRHASGSPGRGARARSTRPSTTRRTTAGSSISSRTQAGPTPYRRAAATPTSRPTTTATSTSPTSRRSRTSAPRSRTTTA